jgi:tetratricopeptide (TPR) repeat protein
MAHHQMAEKAGLRQRRSEEAIALALQCQWEEAMAVNRSIIELCPNDVDAYNRLGKALTELGRCNEAWEAYSHALEIVPDNAIAKRNLERLTHLKQIEQQGHKDRQMADLSIFVEETGKNALIDLHRPAPKEVLNRMAAGEQVALRADGQRLMVESSGSEYLGEIEPKLGLRLIQLIKGGNKYQAAIASVGQNGCRVIVKETYQHPNQAGRPSFPLRAADGFRPYIKDSLLKYELEDEEATDWDDEIGGDLSSFHEIPELLEEEEGEEE